MSQPIDLKRLTPLGGLVGEDEAETTLLHAMVRDAEKYLRSFGWCPPIAERFFGEGVAGVVAVCLFRLTAKVGRNDDWLWVVVGDVPSAYLVADKAPDPGAALAVYCDLMEEWIEAVRTGSSLNEVFPVSATATSENATMLESRIKFIRDKIIARCK